MHNYHNLKLFLKKMNSNHPLFHFVIIALITVYLLKLYHADDFFIYTFILVNFITYCSVIGLLSLISFGNPYDIPNANYVGILFNEHTKKQDITYFKTFLGAWFSVRFQYWWLCYFTSEASKDISYDVRKYTYCVYPNLI